MIPFGGRSTAIKLSSGDVWVLASTPLSEETKATIEAEEDMGDVPDEFLGMPNILASEGTTDLSDARPAHVHAHAGSSHITVIAYSDRPFDYQVALVVGHEGSVQ